MTDGGDNRFTISDYEDRDRLPSSSPLPGDSRTISQSYSLPFREGRLNPIRQMSGGGRNVLRLHHYESSTRSEANERYMNPEPVPTELSALPSLPDSFPSTYSAQIERARSYAREGDALQLDEAEDVDIEKKAALSPATMSRGLSSGSGEAGRCWQTVFPRSIPCRLLLCIVILESLIDLAIEGNILWRFNVEVSSSDSTELELENKRRLPIYLIIFGLAHLWQFVLTVIGIRARNTIQVIAVTAFNFAFLGYAVIEIFELRQILGHNLLNSLPSDGGHEDNLLTLPLNVLTAVIIGVITASSLLLLVIAHLLRREFGMARYRFLGANLQIQRYYFRFQVFECICYFSAFFCAGFGVQFIWLVLQSTDVEYVITWVAFPLSVIILIIGRFAAKYENRPCMAIFMLGLLAGCAYFIFKLVRIWQRQYTTYAGLTKSLTTFDALSLVSLVACLVSGCVVWMDFGKGLKEAVLSKPGGSTLSSVTSFWRARSAASSLTLESEMSMAQRRISID